MRGAKVLCMGKGFLVADFNVGLFCDCFAFSWAASSALRFVLLYNIKKIYVEFIAVFLLDVY